MKKVNVSGSMTSTLEAVRTSFTGCMLTDNKKHVLQQRGV